jgi:predicted ATPase
MAKQNGKTAPKTPAKTAAGAALPDPPRILSLRVRNYRALKDIELKTLTPLTVLLGPNGSGKSTVFDVFSFLSECFTQNLRQAWDRRGRAKELKTRGSDGSVRIEIKYRERPKAPVITYSLEIDEKDGRLRVGEERLCWTRGTRGRPFDFLRYEGGNGYAISGEDPSEENLDQRADQPLRSPDLLAVNTLGQFAEHPRVAALREFITDWHVSYLSVEQARGQPEAGPQERLSKTGDNLANVLQYLREQHGDRLERIFNRLGQRVPRLEKVLAEQMPDGRLLLQIKDGPFDKPIHSRFASDGTLKMLAYLVLLCDPNPPRFIGIEEPENFLHPRLLEPLAEECRAATERSQMLVTTHSPFFLNALRPKEVRILMRNERGYTEATLVSDIPGLSNFVDAGGKLGHLWMEGFLESNEARMKSSTTSKRKARQ